MVELKLADVFHNRIICICSFLHIHEVALCCQAMHFTFISVVFLVLHIAISFDLEGSGEEASFDLGDEELIPYTKTTSTKPELPKKIRKFRNRHLTNTSKIQKGGNRKSNVQYYDLCRYARCSHVCHLNNNNVHCSCRKGFELHTDGKSCKDIDECRYFNGGCEQLCLNIEGSYHCGCKEHYRLRNDSKVCEAFCSPPCLNNGECIGPNTCSCSPGYLQPRCSPICNPPCANGGICKRHNTCKCPDGYSGPICLNALCKSNCLNGGRCIAPNICQCPSHYFGKTCQKALCTPSCENGGTCIKVNQCACRSGFKGPRCQIKSVVAENVACNPYCATSDISSVTTSRPKLKNCVPPCRNGGRCTLGNKCICANGTYGNKCQHRVCPVITFTSRTIKLVRVHLTETFLADCPTGLRQKCVSYRLVEKLIPKTFYKLGYKLHCS